MHGRTQANTQPHVGRKGRSQHRSSDRRTSQAGGQLELMALGVGFGRLPAPAPWLGRHQPASSPPSSLRSAVS
ncbi:hypothetical protein NDU88_008552 [Pleurodeles waltl]|uniref:Uncharacterized protein n=1 Tax=Pleurodeles waltl TaxID=8319 RepID=A0AAV7NZA6_PLEWA|nr:hypothetical protein NDU88_008552 [Pleurodeles waltl]